ncbi:MAG TPA: cupin domain-containing protein [Gaiellaceae bacterium]|nr:cupin domain-containing protein [Gaiellaceae bacterium]
MAYTLLHEGDSSIESFRGVFMKMRRALGTTAFGLNEVRLPPGAGGTEHDETATGHEEVYVVLSGEGTFTIDAEDVSVTQGDYLRVDPSSTRQVVAGPEGLRFIVIGARPQPRYDGRESL